MEEPIEEVYFNWLYSKVASVDNPAPSNTFYTLLRDLHSTEFFWTNAFDENRAVEGLDLRREFYLQVRLDEDDSWMHIGCSVLEMLIPLARRAEFETDIPMREWFWTFMQNLHLAELNDSRKGISQKVARVLDRLVWRTYRYDGYGGLFPLNNPHEDQREVEIYYQFSAYLSELEADGRL